MLMEEETTKAEANLATTVTKLALSSKSADDVMRKVKAVENKCSNNEVTLHNVLFGQFFFLSTERDGIYTKIY